MSSFKIRGRHKLNGCITPQGAKNEALQVICATLLTEEKVTISNVPLIRDVLKLIELVQCLGVSVSHPEAHTFTFEAKHIETDFLLTEDNGHSGYGNYGNNHRNGGNGNSGYKRYNNNRNNIK